MFKIFKSINSFKENRKYTARLYKLSVEKMLNEDFPLRYVYFHTMINTAFSVAAIVFQILSIVYSTPFSQVIFSNFNFFMETIVIFKFIKSNEYLFFSFFLSIFFYLFLFLNNFDLK
jgi:hypothetical protein